TNVILTPTLIIGPAKSSGTVQFGSGNVGNAGSLTLQGITGAGSTTDLTLADNSTAGTSGTTAVGVLNLTTNGVVNASFNSITMSSVQATGAGPSAVSTFTLAGASSSLVTANSVKAGNISGSAATISENFNVTSGTFKFNTGGTGFQYGG